MTAAISAITPLFANITAVVSQLMPGNTQHSKGYSPLLCLKRLLLAWCDVFGFPKTTCILLYRSKNRLNSNYIITKIKKDIGNYLNLYKNLVRVLSEDPHSLLPPKEQLKTPNFRTGLAFR